MSTIFIFYISIFVFTNFLLLLLTFVHKYLLFKNSLITLVLRHLSGVIIYLHSLRTVNTYLSYHPVVAGLEPVKGWLTPSSFNVM